ncbi:MAG: hypothetical protein IKS07_02295 [Lachnospiraceae bacterium]|nr:hypothetical protein [Lachnospiraceae bacterium]
MKVYHKILSFVLVPLLVFSIALYGPIAYASSAIGDAVVGWLTDQALDNIMSELYSSALGVMVSQETLDYEWARRQAAYQAVLSDMQLKFDFQNSSLSDFETFYSSYDASDVSLSHKKTMSPFLASNGIDAYFWYYAGKNNLSQFKDFTKLLVGGYSEDETRDKVENNQDSKHPARISSEVGQALIQSHQADQEDNWTMKWFNSIDVHKVYSSNLGNNPTYRENLISNVEAAYEAGYDIVLEFGGDYAYNYNNYNTGWLNTSSADAAFVWGYKSVYLYGIGERFHHAGDQNSNGTSFTSIFVTPNIDWSVETMSRKSSDNGVGYGTYFGSTENVNYNFSETVKGVNFYMSNPIHYIGVFSIDGRPYQMFRNVSAYHNWREGAPPDHYQTTNITYDPTSGQDYTYNYDTVSSNSYVSSYEYIQNIVEGDTYINGITNDELMALITAIMVNWTEISEGDQDLQINRVEHVETDEMTGTTNTWYSYEYNYVTNNYGGEGQGGGSGEGSGSGTGEGGGSASGAWSALASVFKGLGEAVGGLLTGLVSMVTGIIGSIGKALTSVTDFSAFSDFMTEAFVFVPPQIWSLIFAGVSACVVISIFKALK